jgi:Tol biopolymer transport system component
LAARSSRWVHAALLGALGALVCLALGTSSASAAAPAFTVDPSPTVSFTSAQVFGSIDPGENEVFYAFQYSANPEAEGWASGPQVFSQTLAAGSGSSNVSEELTGLKPGTKYKLRLWTLSTDFSQEWTSGEPYVSFATEPVSAPAATLDPISTHTGTTAHFSGTIDPGAPPGPLGEAAKAAYKTEWHFECSPECPRLSAGTVEAEAGSQAVSADAKGLEPNTTYEVRLVASNAGGPTTASEVFATDLILPGVKTASGGSDGKGGYVLQGIVNPHNSEVSSCRFQYGPTAAYDKEVACTPAPGAGDKAVEVTARLSGLTSGATYHFRLLAANGAGAADGGDASFFASTASSESCPNEAIRAENNSRELPECRGYELVTTAFRAGFSVAQHNFTEDGTVQYGSIAGSIANSGAGSGSGSYVATRASTGWETIANLNGPSESIFANPEAFDVSAAAGTIYSEDLRSSIFYVGKVDESGAISDIYIREPNGTFSLVGPAIGHPLAGEGGPPQPPGSPGHCNGVCNNAEQNLVGASADLSHLVYAGVGFAGIWGPGLFEFVGTGNTAPRRVDVDNSGDPISPCGTPSPPAGAILGPVVGNVVSADGSTIVFTALGNCGGPTTNEVWARVNGTTSYDASASLCTRTVGDPGGACNAPANAVLGGTSADGSYIYFTTAQQLVDGDTNETDDLYEYDLPTAGNPHPSPALVEVSGSSGEAGVEHVVNVSEDGSTVYFVASGVLAPNTDPLGQPAVSGDHNLYVWRRDAAQAGQTTFVAKLDVDDLDLTRFAPNDLDAREAQSTSDGRYLVFATANPLLATDTDSARDVYRYDSSKGDLVRISTSISGAGGNSASLDATLGVLPDYSHRSRYSVSNDGEAVVFTTSEALSPADTNGAPDVYLWKAGHVSLVSDGHPGGGVAERNNFGVFIDGSGQDIYFQTSEALTPNDGNTLKDVYDARVDGGYSFAHTAPCSGEACQRSLSAPPSDSGIPASATPSGSGNLPAPAPAIKPKPKPLSRAQKLAKALKACRKGKARAKRLACEAQAHKRYGARSKGSKPKAKAKSPKGRK